MPHYRLVDQDIAVLARNERRRMRIQILSDLHLEFQPDLQLEIAPDLDALLWRPRRD